MAAAARRARNASPASATMPSAGSQFTPTTSGSMSMWIVRVPGAGASYPPVVISEKRVPRASSASASRSRAATTGDEPTPVPPR